MALTTLCGQSAPCPPRRRHHRFGAATTCPRGVTAKAAWSVHFFTHASGAHLDGLKTTKCIKVTHFPIIWRISTMFAGKHFSR